MSGIREVTTNEVREAMGDAKSAILDTRSSDTYNGWALSGEPRGGHIPGARSLPARWTDFIDWPEMVEGKGLDPTARTILYGEGAASVAHFLERLGFADLCTYPGFADEWLPDETLSLTRLPRFDHLVPPAWLAAALRRERADFPPRADGLVIGHCHYRNESDYQMGHIPGAVSIDTLLLETPTTWNRRTPDELGRALRSLGIRSTTSVVLYGRDSVAAVDAPFPGSSAGQLAAMRVAFILMYSGVEDVRILNGGLKAWEDAGHATSTDPSAPSEAGDFGVPIPARPGICHDLAEVKELLASKRGALVDSRSRPEHEGLVSGYNYIQKKGAIPGAVFVAGGTDAYHMETYRNPDGTAGEHEGIARAWTAHGLQRDAPAWFFCGTGWRASEAFWNGWLMGWPEVGVYDGGWFEWSNDPANPVVRGP